MYDDLNDVSSILDLIRSHESRAVDNAILKISQETPSIKTAIVFPPIIYGKGEGPVKQRSVQIPALSKVALERGHAVRGGRGLAAWTNVHVADLARLFVLLAEKAEKGDDSDKIWGENGIYLPGVGEMVRPLILSQIQLLTLNYRHGQKSQTRWRKQQRSKDTLIH